MLEVLPEELEKAVVSREYPIDNLRRIDLVIETPARFIPIEVKIYAGDQKEQMAAYLSYARIKEKCAKIWYLTRLGDAPTQFSTAGKIKEEDIVCISFERDILRWLDECLKDRNTRRIAPIREIILQLMSAIEGFTGHAEEQAMEEIKRMIAGDRETFKSAAAIARALEEAKTEQIKKLFESVLKKVGEDRINAKGYLDFENGPADKYYKRSGSTCPGISFLRQKNVLGKEDTDLWVRMEIDEYNKVALGCCVAFKGKQEGQRLSEDEILQVVGDEELSYLNWWAYWEYAHIGEGVYQTDDTTDCPDFKENNEAYFSLYDAAVFEQFTNRCAKRIRALLHKDAQAQ